MRRPAHEYTSRDLGDALRRLRERWGCIDFHLSHNDALCLMVAVQVASKSPHYTSSTCKKMVKWAKKMAAQITKDDPALKQLFNNGWREEYGPRWEIKPTCSECGAEYPESL